MWEKKFHRRSWYTLFIHKSFVTRNFLNLKDSLRLRRYFERNSYRRNIVILPPSLLVPINFCDTRNFLEGWKLPLRKLLVPWDKNWSTKPCYANPLLPCPKKVRFQKFFEIWKGSPAKSFSAVRQQTLDVESWLSLSSQPLVSKNFFGTRNFLEDRRVPLPNVLVPWDKKLSKNLCHPNTPPFPKKIRCQNFSEVQKGSPKSFSLMWDNKI